MLTRRELILLKVESTYNTDPTPTPAADAILVGNPSWSHEGATMISRNLIKTTLATDKQLYGGSLMAISFDVEVKGSGSAGTAPDLGQALRACGMGETIVASTSVTYAPVSTSIESATIYYYQDGQRKILTGARGNVSFNMSARGILVASFTFTGHIGTRADVPLASGTFDATEPVPIKGLSFTSFGYAAKISTFEFSLNNTLTLGADISASDGYGEIRIGGRDVAGSIDPEDELVATEDFIADWSGGNTGALDTGAIGATAGNITRIQMPAIAYREISSADRDQVRTLQIGFGAGESSSDDEVSIAFT